MSDPTREAHVAAILHGRFFPGTTHDVGDDDCACETAAILAALSTTPAPESAAIFARHRPDPDDETICRSCGRPWPCDVRKLMEDT